MTLLAGKLSADVGVLGPDRNPIIRIVSSVTPEGKKLTPPSPAKPVVYFPVLAIDEPKPEQDVPTRAAMHAWLKDVLARNGYECVSPQRDRPSQLLVFHWGEIFPELENDVFWNKGQMLDLVAGEPGQALPQWKHMELIGEAAGGGRYFVRVVSYDYAAAKQNKKVMLWHARISTHVEGLTMTGIMPRLIELAGPHLGRELEGPIVLMDKRTPTVELGELEVKEYAPAAPSPAKEPPQKP
jgi:hypothetical protein